MFSKYIKIKLEYTHTHTYHNVWNGMGEFIGLNVYIKMEERSQNQSPVKMLNKE